MLPKLLRPGLVLYIVRHGETDWNAEARYQGQMDIPLNAHGRTQAERNGLALRQYFEDTPTCDVALLDFVASPLSRAQETMRIVRASMGLEPSAFRTDPQIRELHYGHWEGQLATDLPKTDPAGLAARKADPFHSRPEGGESYTELMDRTDAWLATLTRDTVAVTHGGVMRTLRGRLLALDKTSVPRLPVPQDLILILGVNRMGWI